MQRDRRLEHVETGVTPAGIIQSHQERFPCRCTLAQLRVGVASRAQHQGPELIPEALLVPKTSKLVERRSRVGAKHEALGPQHLDLGGVGDGADLSEALLRFLETRERLIRSPEAGEHPAQILK